MAKSLYGENEVIRNMGTGGLFRIPAMDYAQKLAILKAQIDHEYGENSLREAQMRLEEEMGKPRRVGF